MTQESHRLPPAMIHTKFDPYLKNQTRQSRNKRYSHSTGTLNHQLAEEHTQSQRANRWKVAKVGRPTKDQSSGLNESSSGRSRIRRAERLARRPRLNETNSDGALLLGENTEHGTEIPSAEEIDANRNLLWNTEAEREPTQQQWCNLGQLPADSTRA
jgi:hypothetical protein